MYARIFTLYMLSLWLANDGITFAQNSKSVGKDTLSMSYLLSEVVVTASKVKYRYQDNTLIYKVVDDKGAKFAISTVDILRRTPLVTIGAFERIHRSNLIGMGILPLQFLEGESAEILGLDGTETYSVGAVDFSQGLPEPRVVEVVARTSAGDERRFSALVRVDTPTEGRYYANGGILQYVLRDLA